MSSGVPAYLGAVVPAGQKRMVEAAFANANAVGQPFQDGQPLKEQTVNGTPVDATLAPGHKTETMGTATAPSRTDRFEAAPAAANTLNTATRSTYGASTDTVPPPAYTETAPAPAPAPATIAEYNDTRAPGEKPLPESRTAAMPDHIADMATTERTAVAAAPENTTAEDPEVQDLGWNEHVDNIPAPLVEKLPNETLWTLVRRFDKQMYHVKAIPDPPVGQLDLDIAEDEEFSPDKLRANLERLYMTVIIGMLSFVKHVVRLRSWNEPRRTAYFALAYFTAWWLDLLAPLVFGTLILLILYPPARDYLFPPAPMALVSTSTGNLQTPRAGSLGSGDSLTGAPEKHAGEAVEQEASNFVSGFASVAVSSAVGKHPDGEPNEQEKGSGKAPMDKKMPDPTNLAAGMADAKDASAGEDTSTKHDKTKQPMEVMLWTKARPVMHVLADIADGWERFANALSPTPPFSANVIRLKLAGVVAPIMLALWVVPAAWFIKGATAGIGFGFFGDPIISRGVHWLNTNYPNWPQLLELRRTLLAGVPTNAQLTLTLLRLGEANKAPLPPPPISTTPPPSEPSTPLVTHADLPEDLQNSEVIEQNAPPEATPIDPDVHEGKGAKLKSKGSKLVSMVKGATKATLSGALGIDHLKAAAGSENAKQRLGVVPEENEKLADGPSVFTARYHGKKGFVVISTSATTPCMSFVATGAKRVPGKNGEWDPVFSIALNDMREIKKLGGLGWKGRLVVGWAYSREVLDGIEIVDARGETWTLTAMQRRDELFNRLIALADHKWESW